MTYEQYLMHHGIRGQKWGERRFQNQDGSLTPEGKERYRKESLFARMRNASYERKSRKLQKRGVDNPTATDIKNVSKYGANHAAEIANAKGPMKKMRAEQAAIVDKTIQGVVVGTILANAYFVGVPAFRAAAKNPNTKIGQGVMFGKAFVERCFSKMHVKVGDIIYTTVS